MKERLRAMLEAADGWVSHNYVRFFAERNALTVVLFHHLLEGESEMRLNILHPQERTTIKHFRRFIDYHLEQGYHFISPDQVCAGLQPDHRYMLITFDDGYSSNSRMLPILKEYEVSATVFISSAHVQENKAFWWDVIYRKRKAEGASDETIALEERSLTYKTHTQIEEYLIERFGPRALIPEGDLDRPFTASELRSFSEDKHVFLGNHTCHHARLTSYSEEEVRSEIGGAQESILGMTGVMPMSIAYPAGAYSPQIVRVAREAGLKLGITTVQRKNRLPLPMDGDEPFMLSRFTLSGTRDIDEQCLRFRSDVQLATTLEQTKRVLGL